MKARIENEDPSPVLDCARVLAYAIVDDSVTYRERGCFYVDGKLLGPVPRLAVVQYLDKSEILVIHCDDEWNSFGAQGGFEDAKERIERSYQGLMTKWVETGVTETEARAFLEQYFAGRECSFCGRWPMYIRHMVGDDTARICNKCIDKFYTMIHEDGCYSEK